MIVAVASGKGGTGKTTVAASLAAVWGAPLFAVDLDVEAPNLHLFLRPEIVKEVPAFMEIPVVDESKCTFCRACAELCQFKAIAVLGEVVLTFPEMCHGCGGCVAVCPEGAVSIGTRELGTVAEGRTGSMDFLMGRLRVGEAMSPPLMREVKRRLLEKTAGKPFDAIVDSPPGVSCPAVNAVMDSDVIVLVTEPTPFGLYDLRLAVEAFERLGKPIGVVVNRAGMGDEGVHSFCRERSVPILCEIPYDRKIAEAYSKGRVIAETSQSRRELFVGLKRSIVSLAGLPSPAAPEVGHA
jgi:MinD superfamily P-loop ATPase